MTDETKLRLEEMDDVVAGRLLNANRGLLDEILALLLRQTACFRVLMATESPGEAIGALEEYGRSRVAVDLKMLQLMGFDAKFGACKDTGAAVLSDSESGLALRMKMMIDGKVETGDEAT